MSEAQFNFWGREICEVELLALVQNNGRHLQTKGRRVLIQSASPFDRLIWLLGVLYDGGIPVLDEARLLDPLQFALTLSGEISFSDLSITDPKSCRGKILHAEGEIVFTTSGSTGEPNQVVKAVKGLLAEVEQLQALYELHEGGVIVSLVGPLHIYGFLHGILLPLEVGCAGHLVDPLHFEIPKSIPPVVSLLITVPALWGFAKGFFERGEVEVMVTSAGVFGNDRAGELSALERAPKKSYEIFGSTETGGVGYRTLSPFEESFTCFRGIELESESTGTIVKSPFLSPSRSVLIADKLNISDNKRFRFLGRSDRIVKYSGLRVSLSVMEERIEELAGFPVKCLFIEDFKRPQGGHLIAIIASPEIIDLPRLGRSFREKFDSPFPSHYANLVEFPTDENGKVTKAALLRSIGWVSS
jgi:acyl-CoA synthetase (AMP-forming)/AMP-acid ligase II